MDKTVKTTGETKTKWGKTETPKKKLITTTKTTNTKSTKTKKTKN